jgi:hypothetical protein
MFRVRELLVPLMGVSRGRPEDFQVHRVEGTEALIAVDERHLSFCAGVAVDVAADVVRVTTVAKLKGWRGQLYFRPVKMVHPIVIRGMLRGAARSLTPPSGPN